MTDLSSIRTRIDAIDERLVELLNARAELAREVGRAKALTGGAIFVPHREQEVFKRLASLNQGPLPDAALRGIWREVMSASFALERPLTICHFGQAGAFTHLAARLKFGSSVEYAPADAITAVFSEVEKGRADYGVVPIENSTDGSITDTIDAFHGSTVRIVSELHLRVRHHLMSAVPRQDIRRIYSRSTVFGQCRGWLAANMAKAELVEVVSTTKAAERAAAESADGAAAIGSDEAAKALGLPVLASDLQDNPNNMTRFVVVAKPQHAAQPSGDDKTTLMFAVSDRPGALYDCLTPFHRAGINLCKIESRPSRRRAWEYLFFIDLLGHQRDEKIAAALAELGRSTAVCEILGSYPRADQPLNA
ncbi:MAG TPA: prephenate dehydratase [Planctomycetes bacterium]|nr:prephenate dehydratase [Planctomycetota bacterium]